MADSTLADMSEHTLMIASMAFRVKYRVHKISDSSVSKYVKMQIRIENSGVHKNNRASVYPSGNRCRSLCHDVVRDGFLKEEVNHACIAVEEPPLGASKEHVESASAYNARKSEADEWLRTCFQVPYNDVRHTLLSHNHMMMVLRAFITRAPWNMPDVDGKHQVCDSDGRLSVTAVAASPNGKEFAEVLAEGFMCEILSWKMDVEEPKAALIISQAMNNPHQLAMHTSELTAIAVLKGEIIVQMSKDVSQRVAFETVRDRVRKELSSTADDPDLPEVFDWLISAGAGKNSYVDEFLEWTAIFVDSKKRRLRYTAWAVVNKMASGAVWARVAVLKRAYRKKPTLGYCPSPEVMWGYCGWLYLEVLEDLLRFFHVVCKPCTDALKPQSRIQLLANIDICATDEFDRVKSSKSKYNVAKIKAFLLEATLKYLEPLALNNDQQKLESLKEGRAGWIQWTTDHVAKQPGQPSCQKIATVVIEFDETSGIQLNQQLDFPMEQKKKEALARKLPWREWITSQEAEGGRNLGSAEADHAAAVAVLHGIHERYPVEEESVDIWQTDKSAFVAATKKVGVHGIRLPLCIPRQSKLVQTSTHPFATKVEVVVQASQTQDDPLRIRRFFANPEWLAPTAKPKTAVAGRTQPGAAAVADAGEVTWEYAPIGQTTMHPFWAVRRLTEIQLDREIARAKTNEKLLLPRFNCAIEYHVFSSVNVGVVNKDALNITRMCHVPFLTNQLEIEEGEELILKADEKPKIIAAHARRTWKEAFVAKEKASASTKKKAKSKCVSSAAAVSGAI